MEDSLKLFCMLGILVCGLVKQLGAMEDGGGLGPCWFPAIYNFGDSNSDTGGRSAAFNAISSPNGETFFGHPAGRACDGRLVIDFIAEHLKLPYLSAYLDSVGADFEHGANFATGGSSIILPGYSPFDLGIQIAQFIQFKSRTTALYEQLKHKGRIPPFESNLPRPEDFPKALYTFDIGQNDLAYGFQHTTEKEVRASIPNLLNQLSEAVHLLYNEGARFFWVHNTGPLGCLPYSVIYNHGNRDKSGCVESRNQLAMEFNRQLKDKISALRTQLPYAEFTYVDVYSAKYAVISNAEQLGFVNPFNFCCGSFYGYHIDCGKKAIVNGTVYGNPCNHPSRHISWDGIHYSEAANRLIANHIVDGSLSDPPVPIQGACHHPRNI
ncbi:hypothetical protein SLEP1_g45346 [Rubroshorea leprosula]|uniref:Uncharacterized protein n=1 Tax=Rubroshorea leprosula TaxID=152421 RepID=A0AAV5LJJ3_9ROSI|nr:hypothetical protein SLEP1_g45346 [Rubroshorea leprosula]